MFSAGFSRLLNDFVAAVIAWIAPWMAIFLVDWLLRRQRYVPLELQRTDSGGLYWRRGGVHWPALVAQALGTVASVLAFNQAFYVGPIARALRGWRGRLQRVHRGSGGRRWCYWLAGPARVSPGVPTGRIGLLAAIG